MVGVIAPTGLKQVPGKGRAEEYDALSWASCRLLLIRDINFGAYYAAVQGEVQPEIWADRDKDGEADEGEISYQYERAWGTGTFFDTDKTGWWPAYFSVAAPHEGSPSRCGSHS